MPDSPGSAGSAAPSGGASPGGGQAGTSVGSDRAPKATVAPSGVETGFGGGKGKTKEQERNEQRERDRERLQNKVKEVKEQVISPEGTDSEGKIIREGFREAITTEAGKNSWSPAIRDLNETYRRARESADNLDRAGEADKLLASLEALHKQVGLDDYELKVQIEKGDLPEGEETQKKYKAEQVRKKLKEDFDGFFDRAVDEKLMVPYYEQRARVELATEDTQKAVSKKDISRSEVRRAAYKQERAENRLQSVGERMLEKLGQGNRVAGIYYEQGKRRYDYEGAEFKSLDQMGKDAEGNDVPEELEARDDLIEARTEDYRKHLADKSTTAVESFDHLGNQKELVTRLLNTELGINNARENLQRAVQSGNTERISGWADRVKDLELEHQAQESQMEAALAGQRRVDSLKKVAKSWDELGNSLTELKGNQAKAAKKFLAAGKEVVDAHVGYAKNWIKKALPPVLRNLEQGKQSVGAAFSDLRNRLDDQLEVAYEVGTAVYEEAVTDSIEDARSRAARVKSEARRHKVDADRWFKRRRREVDIVTKRAWVTVVAGKDEAKMRAAMRVGELMQGITDKEISEDELNELKNRRKELVEQQEGEQGINEGEEQELNKINIEIGVAHKRRVVDRWNSFKKAERKATAVKMRRDNPYLNGMIDRLADKVVEVVGPEPEGPEAEAEEEGEEAPSLEELRRRQAELTSLLGRVEEGKIRPKKGKEDIFEKEKERKQKELEMLNKQIQELEELEGEEDETTRAENDESPAPGEEEEKDEGKGKEPTEREKKLQRLEELRSISFDGADEQIERLRKEWNAATARGDKKEEKRLHDMMERAQASSIRDAQMVDKEIRQLEEELGITDEDHEVEAEEEESPAPVEEEGEGTDAGGVGEKKEEGNEDEEKKKESEAEKSIWEARLQKAEVELAELKQRAEKGELKEEEQKKMNILQALIEMLKGMIESLFGGGEAN